MSVDKRHGRGSVGLMAPKVSAGALERIQLRDTGLQCRRYQLVCTGKCGAQKYTPPPPPPPSVYYRIHPAEVPFSNKCIILTPDPPKRLSGLIEYVTKF